jgi:hypothetical protein
MARAGTPSAASIAVRSCGRLRVPGSIPSTMTYSLRHSSIVRQLLAGTPIRIVAHAHDTSVGMLERTYSRFIGDHADTLLRGGLLDLAAPAGDNVVPLARKS